MKTKEQIIEIFHLACADAKPEKITVNRYNKDIRDLSWGASVVRLFYHAGKSKLVYLEEGKTVKDGISMCQLSDEEHENLKAEWEKVAQLKYIITWWKEIKNQSPETITPHDLTFEVFYLQTFDAIEFVWTKELQLAQRYELKSDAEKVLSVFTNTHDGVFVSEVGINNN